MKRILLTSTALIAFAGAAAAEVTFAGAATLGYNDDVVGDNVNFYQELTASVTLSQTLDNGLTAAASIDLADLSDGAAGFGDYELSLTSDSAGLYYGDTGVAAPVNFDAGSALDNAADADFDEDTLAEGVLRGEATFGTVSAAVSYGISVGNELTELQVSAAASLGAANVSMAYQDGDHDGLNGDGDVDYTNGELFALGVTTSAAGADLSFGYANSDNDSTVGFGVSYPTGPVTLSANYAVNDVAENAWTIGAAYAENGVSAGVEFNSDDSWEITGGYATGPVTISAAIDSADDFSLEGTYDVGNGLAIAAGMQDAGDTMYVAGNYDLGGGANLLVSFVDTATGLDDLEDFNGEDGYQNGTTVELSFEF